MAKSRYESAEQMLIKREIDRINRQIKMAYKNLGEQSYLATQYRTILQGAPEKVERDSLLHGKALNLRTGKIENIVRFTDAGIPQLSTGKSTLNEFQNITAMRKQLKMLGKLQTVAHTQEQMIKAYRAENPNVTKITRKDKAAIIQEMADRYAGSENFRQNFLNPLYEYEKKNGVSLVALNEIRATSKGKWTSQEEYEQMIEIAKKADKEIKEGRARIIQDAFAENQW